MIFSMLRMRILASAIGGPSRVRIRSATRRGLQCRPQVTSLEDRVTPVNLNNVLVNNPQLDVTTHDTQSETSTIVFPNKSEPGKVVVMTAYNDSAQVANGHVVGLSKSTDATSSAPVFTDLNAVSPYGRPVSNVRGDPSIARDASNGTVYVATLSSDQKKVPIHRMDENGNWLSSVDNAMYYSGETTSRKWDKEWMTVDNFTGTGNGNIYVAVWDETGTGNRIFFSRVTGGSQSFPSVFRSQNGIMNGLGANVVVGPDHAVYVFSSYPGTGVYFCRSDNFGSSFSNPALVATQNSIELDLSFRTNCFPQAAVNPATGEIYVVYNDKSASDDDHGNIWLVRSSNQGATWSSPIQVNDDGTKEAQFFPSVAVTPDGTKLTVSFYDCRNDTDGMAGTTEAIDYFAAIADISGESVVFRPNLRISTQSFPVVKGVDSYFNIRYMGDYDVVSADNNNFYFVWSDNRDPSDPITGHKGNQQNVRFAKASVNATAPEVLSYAPNGIQRSAIDHVNIFFNQGMDTTSFSFANDLVSFTGPGSSDLSGANLAFSWLSNKQLKITFNQQSTVGDYKLVLEPTILSASGKSMDDNLNGTAGETADRLTVSVQFGSYVVDSTSDVDDNNFATGQVTLREAIRSANTIANVNNSTPTITFGSSLLNGSISLGSQIKITDAVTIIGPGNANSVTINGGSGTRIFELDIPSANQPVTLVGLILTGDTVTLSGNGGAILNGDDNLTLARCTISSRTVSGSGGAIYSGTGGSVTLIDTTVSGNRATGNLSDSGGGGIAADSPLHFTIANSTINNNTATKAGGGIYFPNGVSHDTTYNIRNSTIAFNVADRGGGVFINGTAGADVPQFYNCTIASNSATNASGEQKGGGIYFINLQSSETVTLDSTIVANNTASDGGPDIFGTDGKVADPFGLIGNMNGFAFDSGASTGNKNGGDAKLDTALKNNSGGVTNTIAILSGSAAFDAGRNTLRLLNDQRGSFYRYVSQPDIGAYESTATSPTVQSVVINDGNAQRSMLTKITITFSQSVTFTSPGGAYDAITLLRTTALGTTEQSGLTGAVNMDAVHVGNVVTLTFLASGANPINAVNSSTDNASLPDGVYTLTILAANVNDGNFDGNLRTETGDSYVMVGSKTDKLYRLFGDSNGDAEVSNSEFNAFVQAYNAAPGAQGNTFDYDENGDVDDLDFEEFLQRYGGFIPGIYDS